MRNLLLLIPLLFLLNSCIVKGEYKTAEGTVIRTSTGEGVPDQTIEILSSYDHKIIMTDKDGKFSTKMKGNYGVSLYYVGDNNYYGNASEQIFPFHEPMNIQARKYGRLNVHIKNKEPFDENDYFHFHLNQEGQPYIYIDDIENHGVTNLTREYHSSPFEWKGTNVNAIIHYRILEDYGPIKVYWTMKKMVLKQVVKLKSVPSM